MMQMQQRMQVQQMMQQRMGRQTQRVLMQGQQQRSSNGNMKYERRSRQ